MTKQIPLPLSAKPEEYTREDFIDAPENEQAVTWIEAWPEWGEARQTLLLGEKGAGKTHLAHIFSTHSGATFLPYTSAFTTLKPKQAYIIDDCQEWPEARLLDIFNQAKSLEAYVLYTAPLGYEETILHADWKSRVAAMRALYVMRPSQELLMQLLAKLFSDRQLRVEDSVLKFMASRMERSYKSARAMVEKLDKLALEQRRNVTLPLAKMVLEN